MRAVKAIDVAAAKRSPSGVLREQNPRERIAKTTDAAAAKRSPSGVLREQNPRERILLCAKR